MKKKFILSLTVLTLLASVVPLNVAHASTTSNYAQTEGELENMIRIKTNKIHIDNNTKESEFLERIESAILDDDEYDIEITDFNKDEATLEESGEISFHIQIDDADGGHYKVYMLKTIPKIATYTYVMLPELGDKYLDVTGAVTIHEANENELDSSKYLVTRKALEKYQIVNSGWQTVDGLKYYIDKTGVKKGWAEISGVTYHFDELTGRFKTGWEQYNGKWYFMDGDGKVMTGFKMIDSVTYYLNIKGTNLPSDGITLPNVGSMATGWKQMGTLWYFFDNSGAMQVGWKLINGKWYYFSATGIMASNTKINGYSLGKDGALI